MGGGNCLFGTEIAEDKTTPLFRGNVAIVEIESLDANPTIPPDTGVFYNGALNTATRCFDVICTGKCETGTSDRVKLDVQPASKIPDFFTKNSEGKIVFAAPQVVGTVKAAKGYNSWVQIELKSVNGNIDSDVAKHVCLGIKKNDEDSFFDIIHAGNLTSRYVDVTQESYIELVPLLSGTATTESTGYVAVTPGKEVSFTDITIPTTGEFNFGSVYRVNISVHDGQWLTDQTCDLYGGSWINSGRMGIGPVTDQSGKTHENQLFAVNDTFSTLAYSSDGAHWTENCSVRDDLSWRTSPVYGNGIWCAVAELDGGNYGVRRSINGGKIWSETLPDIATTEYLDFGNGVFMNASYSEVFYTSPDAETWTPMGTVNFSPSRPGFLVYGSDKWICGSDAGYVYQSKDNGKTWEQIGDGLRQIGTSGWSGACYVSEYFYVICNGGTIARSSDGGASWKKVFSFDRGGIWYCNITYYKNKLWAFANNGQKYVVGLFNPDGTIESLEN